MRQLIKYPGSKWSLAEWITGFFPEHYTYLEPFFGSGACFFKKHPSKRETINDLDGQIVNLFRVCRNRPDELARAIYLTPYSRSEYEKIQENHAGEEIHLTGDEVEDARRFVIRCSQSFGSKLADRAGWKTNRNSNGPIAPKIWNKLPQTVMAVADRLKDAQIECKPAVELIQDYNFSDCLIYADPPYLGETRGGRLYRVEMMQEQEHLQLLETLKKHQGPVILSGYENDLYNASLSGWHKEQRSCYADGARARIEVLWMNFEPVRQMKILEE